MTDDSVNSYTYDAEGNIMAEVASGATETFTYNALNQRVRTVAGSNAGVEFVFNAAGQRVSVWNGTTQAQIQGQYYWGGKSVAFYEAGAAHFQHQDWLGTVRVRTAYNYNNGGVEGSFTSLPFGDDFTVTGSDIDPQHFATLDHDSVTDTDHAQFRQYSNAQGRWMSPDPYGGSYDATNPESFNRYSYALNNPLTFIDPSGLFMNGAYCGDDCGDDPCGSDNYVCVDGGSSYNGCDVNLEYCGPNPLSPNYPTAPPISGGGGAPNNGPVTCSTVLPNGQTVGSYVNQLSNQINSSSSQSESTPYGPAPVYTPGLSPLSIPGAVYSGTNFRQMFGGPGANYTLLGDAGNFAYFAVSANIGVPLWAAEAVAGAYSLTHHPASDWVGPFGMDPSATRTVSGYGAKCN